MWQLTQPACWCTGWHVISATGKHCLDSGHPQHIGFLPLRQCRGTRHICVSMILVMTCELGAQGRYYCRQGRRVWGGRSNQKSTSEIQGICQFDAWIFRNHTHTKFNYAVESLITTNIKLEEDELQMGVPQLLCWKISILSHTTRLAQGWHKSAHGLSNSHCWLHCILVHRIQNSQTPASYRCITVIIL